jgi:outer membrane receptor protein involved in Fe transport
MKILVVEDEKGMAQFLPSVQVQYLLEKNTNLRANYSIGTSRPNLQDLVPTTIVDPNTSNRGTVTLGNPNLKPTRANNYDLLVLHIWSEWTLRLGLCSI